MGFIRPLREADDRSRFHSGDPHLDRYFQHFAGQNQFRHHLSVTYVFEEAGAVQGYVTVAGGQIRAEQLPKGSKNFPAYPLPTLRIARLAVSSGFRGKGIGAQLLRQGLRLALEMSTAVGCVGVIVDSKPDSEAFYRRFGFMPTQVLQGDLLAGSPLATYFISLPKIKTALSSP